jgi:hypothetical protein
LWKACYKPREDLNERDQIRVRIGTLPVKRADSEEGEDWMLFVRLST